MTCRLARAVRGLLRPTSRRKVVRFFPRSAPPNGKQILVYSPVPWELGRFEIGLGLALRARGYEVVTYICGGGFSACEMENAKTRRPPCDACVRRAIAQQEDFGFVPREVSNWIGPEDVGRARQAARDWDGRDLAGFTYEGMPVGANVADYLHNYYHAATYQAEYDAGHVLNARRCLESSILYFVSSRRILAAEQPDLLILSNGKNLVYRPFFHHSALHHVRTITWDETDIFENSLIVNHDCPANEIHLEGIWGGWRSIPLADEENQRLDRFLSRREAGREGRLPIAHAARDKAAGELRSLGWDGQRPIVAVFPNMNWDTAVVGRHVGFASLDAWICDLVQAARGQSELVFVFRAHPHEHLLPRYYASARPTRTVLDAFGPPPQNLIFVPPHLPLNSYQLGALAKHRLLYTGTLGLEFAVEGRAALVCGDTHYRGRGFTVDVEGREHMFSLIKDDPIELTPAQRALARRYMYLLVFRHLVRVEGMDRVVRDVPNAWFANLVPGASEYWGTLLEAILGRREFDFGPNPDDQLDRSSLE